ncbi:cathepsin G-like [Amyelois transitella]|uniref:cathepsin G-like n=1 Tax=Amyelois transitella TaxID=680683 RepID=UPI00298FBD59|nr:cathepsin G-like [Amyelois transitella]
MVTSEIVVSANDQLVRSYAHRRVLHGFTDRKNSYPYVIRVMWESRPTLFIGSCTGFLISSQWALTAAHCLRPNLRYIKCGTSIALNKTKCVANILKQIPHPAFLPVNNINDIALLHVDHMEMNNYARLNAADYKTLEGRAARYAGFGYTHYNIKSLKFKDIIEHDKKPLQIGEGAIYFGDEKQLKGLGRPQILIAPKCSNPRQHLFSGDSGGPLIVDNTVTGIACFLSPKTIPNPKHPASFGFTPVSPFIDWIREIMAGH